MKLALPEYPRRIFLAAAFAVFVNVLVLISFLVFGGRYTSALDGTEGEPEAPSPRSATSSEKVQKLHGLLRKALERRKGVQRSASADAGRVTSGTG